MKRIIIVMVLALNVIMALSQEFVVTHLGLLNKDDTKKGYLVLNFEDKVAEELYNSTIKYIIRNYKGAERIIDRNTVSEIYKGIERGGRV